MIEKRYPYKSDVWMLGLMLSGVMLIMTVVMAFLSIQGGGSASALVAIMGVLVALLLAFTGWAYVRETRSTRAIVLGDVAISAPASALSATMTTVPYADISDAQIMRLKNSSTLRITHAAGGIGIPVGAVHGAATLEQILSELTVNIAKAKTDA